MRYISYLPLFAAIIMINSFNLAQAEDKLGYTRLNDVFAYLYHDNPELKAARAELDATKELYPQARAGWLPTVSAEASIYATDIENDNFSNGDGATTKEYGLNLDQPIFRGGRTFAEVDEAHDLIRAGEYLLKKKEQEILLNAAEAYMNILHDQEILALRQKNQRLLQSEYSAAQERLRLGDITVTDVQQAKVRLARAEAKQRDAEAALHSSYANFESVTGMSSPQLILLPEAHFAFPEHVDELIAMAEDSNPELHLTNYRYQAADHNVDATFRELMPHISGFASYNHQYDPQPGIVDETETQTIGLRATITLFQGGATRSRIREARSRKEQRRYETMDIQRKIREAVLSNWHDYKSATAQIKSRALEIEAAKDALKGVREEAKIGQRTVLDILDADAEEVNARIAYTNAKRDEMIAKFTLAKTIGILKPEYLNE